LSDSRTLGCIKGFCHPLCIASFGKSDYFLPFSDSPLIPFFSPNFQKEYPILPTKKYLVVITGSNPKDPKSVLVQ